MKLGLVGALSFAAAACGAEEQPRQDLTDSNDPVYQVDLSKCPRTPEWPKLRLPNGELADVTIVQLGERKLYIPMAWLRERGWRSVPRSPSTGVIADFGGGGSSTPGLDRHFRNNLLAALPNCPGVVHVIAPNPTASGSGPDFALTLFFDRSVMGPPDNDHSGQQPTVYHHHSINLSFRHDRTYRTHDLVGEMTLPLPARDRRPVGGTGFTYGTDTAGWLETGSDRSGAFSVVNNSESDGLNPAFAGVDQFGTTSFRFWAAEAIMVTYHVQTRYVPPEKWSSFRQPLRDLLTWLSAPPAERDNERRFSLQY